MFSPQTNNLPKTGENQLPEPPIEVLSPDELWRNYILEDVISGVLPPGEAIALLIETAP